MVRLAEKDPSTEEYTRRVAALAVAVGEAMGLPPTRLLSMPTAILRKPASLEADEFTAIKRHPESGRDLLRELGGLTTPSRSSSSITTSAWTAAAIRAG
jgi:HD-GYP domain-containing protein (c-di-GMP phosphodiesterase class II)